MSGCAIGGVLVEALASQTDSLLPPQRARCQKWGHQPGKNGDTDDAKMGDTY